MQNPGRLMEHSSLFVIPSRAPNSECFCQIRGICQASSGCVRADNQQEIERRLQEGMNGLF